MRINIATSLNSKYVRYTYIMLTSLLENQNKDNDIHIYLLHCELTEEEQLCLQKLVESYNASMHYLYVDKDAFSKECPVSDTWSIEAYFRLMLVDMDLAIDRLLYLDVDMIINKPLDYLFELDFEGNDLIACKDLGYMGANDARLTFFKEKFENGYVYFCSGMLVMNIPQLQQNYSFSDYIDVAEKLEYKMVAPDQDLLNYVHAFKVKYVDPSLYNLFPRIAYNQGFHYDDVLNIPILHFAGAKPWDGMGVHYDCEQVWWDYAKKSPYYYELLEEFSLKVINDSSVYDNMKKLADEKNALYNELQKTAELCQKLYSMIQQ